MPDTSEVVGDAAAAAWTTAARNAWNVFPEWQQKEITAQSQIATQKKYISAAKKGVTAIKTQITTLEAEKAAAVTPEAKAAKQKLIDAAQRNLSLAQDAVTRLTAELDTIYKRYDPNYKPTAQSTIVTGTTGGTTTGGYTPNNKPMEYNVLAVKEAYFTSRPEFLLETDLSNKNPYDEKLSSSVNGDLPVNPAKLVAADLWRDGKATKGMLSSWQQSNEYYLNTGTADQNLLGQKASNAQFPPQGFRFQYNPGSISMAYAGTPLVDPNFEASGQDRFNLVGTGVTQSTIQFQILINRMFDMKYYWREDDKGHTAGTLKLPSADLYGTTVSEKTQKAIYNLGTMYDLEYLLRTLMGYTMKSYMRDYSFLSTGGTADMGYLGARPVELHLGKNLRYLVYVTGIMVEHVIFDSRMVPIFSNVSITCSRLPDYQQVAKGTK